MSIAKDLSARNCSYCVYLTLVEAILAEGCLHHHGGLCHCLLVFLHLACAGALQNKQSAKRCVFEEMPNGLRVHKGAISMGSAKISGVVPTSLTFILACATGSFYFQPLIIGLLCSSKNATPIFRPRFSGQSGYTMVSYIIYAFILNSKVLFRPESFSSEIL